MASNLGPQAIDSTARYQITLGTSDGSSLSGVYDGSETFGAYLWMGADRAPSATLTAAWDTDVTDNPASLSSPVVLLTIAKDSISALAPGVYRVQILLNPGTDDIEVYRDVIELVAGARGAAVAGPTYCSMSDIRRLFPLLSELVQARPDLTSDFSEQREDARRWLDRELMARTRRALISQDTRHAPVVAVDPIWPTTGLDAGSYWGDSIYPDTNIRDQATTVRGYLDADNLMLTDGLASRITAHYAIYLACDGMPGKASSEETWGSIGKHHLDRARSLKTGWVAQLDTDDDGVADVELVF